MSIYKKIIHLIKEKLFYYLILIFFTSVFPVNAFDFGSFSFDIQPKVPTDNGSLADFGIGYHYTDKISSEVRLNINERKTNEQFSGVENSLNAVNHSEWNWYFLPLIYSFIRDEQTHFSVGAGVNYYQEKLEENGYFNMAFLETPVNAYINNFSMNRVGPVVETEFSHAFTDVLRITINAGIAPFGFFKASQKVDIIPLFDFGAFTHNQSNSGVLSFQGQLKTTLFNLVDISGAYYGSSFTFDVIDFDDSYNAMVSKKKSYSQSIQVEGSVKINVDPIDFNIGIGGIFSSVYLDSQLTTEGRRLYFVFGGKKRYL